MSWQDYGNAAIRELYPTLRQGVDYAWAKPDPDSDYELRDVRPGITIEMNLVQAFATKKMGLDPYYPGYEPNPPAPPVVTLLNPTSAQVGAAALTLSVLGTGFTDTSEILWNNGAEPTTFVSATEITTGVDPTTASGPYTVPIQVSNGGAISNAKPFVFTA